MIINEQAYGGLGKLTVQYHVQQLLLPDAGSLEPLLISKRKEALELEYMGILK
jgi:hypothetical protein